MRLKWLAFTFFLGMIIILDPTQTPAQQGGSGGKKGMKGMFPGAGGTPPSYGAAPSLAPAATAFPAPTGGQPAPGSGFNPGGGFGGPGGRNGGGQPGGGGPPGGGRGGNPDGMWMGLQRSTNSTGDTVDLSQMAPEAREFWRTRAGMPIPDSGVLTKAQFFMMYAANDASRQARGNMGANGPQTVVFMGADAFGKNNQFNPNGPDNTDGIEKPILEKGGPNRKNEKKEVEEEKPALRYGKIPKEILEQYPWFEEDDVDKDGQIALWEWRKAGKSISEFNDMDLNGDGLITADELVRWKQRNEDAARIVAFENGERPKPAASADKRGPKGNGPKPGNAKEGDAADASSTEKPGSDPEKGKPADKASPKDGKPNPFMTGGTKDDNKPKRKN